MALFKCLSDIQARWINVRIIFLKHIWALAYLVKEVAVAIFERGFSIVDK